MSSFVLPALAGIGWDIVRKPMWKTQIQTAVSGKETRMAYWSYPRYTWEITYNFLRQGVINGTTFTELAQFFGFFNNRAGAFDSFLYEDRDDNAVTGQAIGFGDAVETQFQLVRAFGNYTEPMLAPNTVSAVYLDGVAQPSGWSVSGWGTDTPGVITFDTPPAAGVVITVDFSYYFPVRFVDDSIDFKNFLAQLYDCQTVSFISVKN